MGRKAELYRLHILPALYLISLKILVLNNRYPSRRKPFVGSYVQTINELLKNKHQVELLVSRINPDSKALQIIDLLIYRIRLRFTRKISQSQLVFAHHFNLYWHSLSRKLSNRQRLIIHWHGSELFGSKRFQAFRKWNSDPKFLSALHITPSEYFKREVLKEFPYLKVFVIPSGGIDTGLFAPNVRKKNTSEVVIGFAGHLNYEKGVDYLLKAAQQKNELEKLMARKVRIRAIKYGVKDPQIVESLESEGVEVLDPVPKDKMPQYYNSLDYLIFPTRRKSESLGLVPLEAMACGVPVLCPDAFACPEYCVSGKTGELFRLEDEADFIVKLKILMSGEYLPRALVEERYSRQSATKLYLQAVQESHL